MSHMFKNVSKIHNCKSPSTPDYFQIVDSNSSKFRLKLKEAIHITWPKPALNRPLKQMSISVTV